MIDFLKKVSMFANLPEEDLERLSQMIEQVRLPAGAVLFTEGSPGDQAYIVQDGQIEIIKAAGGRKVLLAVLGAGEMIGEISLLEAAPRSATGQARTDSVLLSIRPEQFDQLLNTSPSATQAILKTVTARLRSTEMALRQSEKMAQLSTLTAGIAHELNNPAAAVQRSTDQLVSALAEARATHYQITQFNFSPTQMESLAELSEMARQGSSQPAMLDALGLSDRESEIENWLQSNGLENSWQVAPPLASLGLQQEKLAALMRCFSTPQLAATLSWVASSHTVFNLLEEICQGAGRINLIVKAMRTYVNMEKSPLVTVQVHENLEKALTTLSGMIGPGIHIQRQFAQDLSSIQAHPNELGLVWTNILDNALDTLNGQGEVILRTRQENYWVVVEIEDNGPGIPDNIQPKIFSPFFTTKPVGKGAGLGLNNSYNIVQKDGGTITFLSSPGCTIFTVRLPTAPEATN